MLGCTLSEGFLSGWNTANFFFQRNHPFSPWWKTRRKPLGSEIVNITFFLHSPHFPRLHSAPADAGGDRSHRKWPVVLPGVSRYYKVVVRLKLSASFSPCFFSVWVQSVISEQGWPSWDKAHCLKEGIALLFIWRNTFVFEGCQKKVLQSGWPKEQNFFSSQVWRLDVQDQGVSRAVFPGISLVGLYMPAFSLCLHIIFSVNSSS